MARRQNPWDADPVVDIEAIRQDEEREAQRAEATARYYASGRPDAANPGARTVLPGDPEYAGLTGEFDPNIGAIVTAPALNESQLAAAREAERRIIGTSLGSGGGALYQGLLLGASDELSGEIARGGQAASNLIRTLTDQPIEIQSGDLRDAMVATSRAEQDRFAREQPLANVGLQIAGGALTGGYGAARSGVANAVRVGAGYGGAYGFGAGEGNLIDRLPGAAVGAVTGAVTGGAIQGGVNAATPYVQRLAGIAGVTSRPPRIRRDASPQERSAARFVESMDGPAAFAERDRLRALGLNPSVMDVTGNTTERLVRTAAGPAGPGAELAVTNQLQRTANLKPEIMSVTQGLSPDPRSATAVRDGLEQTRDSLASTQYAEPYAAPITLTEDAIRALRGRDGQAAIERAMRGAEANQNYEQMAELQSLIGAELDAIPTITAGTLDRVRIAARDISSNFMRGDQPDRVMAAGYAGRVQGIDTALDAAPGLTEARSTFRNLSGAIDTIDNRPSVFNTDPRDFNGWVRNLTPEQRQAAVVGVRQDILDQLGGQRQAGTGALDQLAQAPYARQNLEALLGQEEAAQYLGSIQERVRQAQRAARVSPNTNSQTFGRSMDEQTMGVAERLGALSDGAQAVTGNIGALARTIDRIRARATMSPEEREAIVQLGIGSADELERIVQLAESARRSGRRPPREVRAWVTETRNALGAQSPVAIQLERLLLSSPVSAEEQSQ